MTTVSPSTSASRRRVVFVCGTVPAPGVQSGPVLLRHLERLARTTTVVCCHRETAPAATSFARLPIPSRRWYFPPARRWLPATVKLHRRLSARHLARALKLTRGDRLLCCAHHLDPLLAHEMSRVSGAPLTILVHDLWPDRLASEYRAVFRAAATILPVSHELGRCAEEAFGVPSTVLRPIGENFLAPAPEADPARLMNPYVGIAGSLSAHYLDTALLFGQRVLSIGGPATSHPRLLQVERFPRNIDALKHLQAHCRALLVYQPADSGNYGRFSFPSKLVDFCQTGLPLILCAPAVSPLGVWARDHRWSLYVEDPRDTVGIARISERLESPDGWREASEQTRNVALTEFSAERLQTILEKALDLATDRAETRA